MEDKSPRETPTQAPADGEPAKKERRGSRPGEYRGGRRRGTKNKRTIEREREALLAEERARLLLEARAQEGEKALKEAAAQGRKLMKEIGFDLANIFAQFAAYHQPAWERGPNGLVATNPHYDPDKFREYAVLAAQTARDFAGYESPKLSAVMVGSAVVNEIEVIGGLPDADDGGLSAADDHDGPVTIDGAATVVHEGEGKPPDVPSGAGGGVPVPEQTQGPPVRKAVG